MTTPALRSAIAGAVLPHVGHFTACNPRGLVDDILAALTPFLAPAPVEQARGERSLTLIVHEIAGAAAKFKGNYQLTFDAADAILTRHFQSLATENKVGGAVAVKHLDGKMHNVSWETFALINHLLDRARAATGKGYGK